MIQKYSRQRELLLEVLRSRKDHPTADDIYAAMRQKIPNISLGTVYRNLSSLSEAGQVLRIDGSGPDRFDGDTRPHYHFACERCGSVLDVDLDTIDMLDSQVEAALGAKVHGHRTMFFGTCPHCLEPKS